MNIRFGAINLRALHQEFKARKAGDPEIILEHAFSKGLMTLKNVAPAAKNNGEFYVVEGFGEAVPDHVRMNIRYTLKVDNNGNTHYFNRVV